MDDAVRVADARLTADRRRRGANFADGRLQADSVGRWGGRLDLVGQPAAAVPELAADSVGRRGRRLDLIQPQSEATRAIMLEDSPYLLHVP